MHKMLVVRLDTHRAHTFCDQVADRVVHHGRRDASPHSETVRQVCSNVELTAAHMDCERMCLAKRNDAGVEPIDECPKGEQVECPVFRDFKAEIHVLTPV